MRARRLAALVGSTILFLVLISRLDPGELARRADFLARSASHELAVRRLEGSGAAFDRGYFRFLESARRRLPPGARGLAIYTPHRTTEALYLASYQLAPVPVLLAPANVPPRWMAAYHAVLPPPGSRIVAELPGGALVAPSPARDLVVPP